MEETEAFVEEETRDAELAAHSVISEIINRGGELIYKHYIDGKSVPFSVQFALSMMTNTLEMFYIRRDEGEQTDWAEEEEPVPCKIDTWARSAIPVRRKVKVRPPENSSQAADVKSVKSFRSTRSGISKVARATKTLKAMESVDERRPVKIEEVQEEVSQEEEAQRARKERQLKRKREEADRLRALREEEEENQRKLAKEAEELKNKPFTYDHTGKIILITPLKYDKMPPTALGVKFQLAETPPEEPPKPEPSKKKPVQPVKLRKDPPKSEQQWVRNVTSIQPPMYDSIALAPGVTLVEGNRTKYPEASQNAKKTMTRREYKNLTQNAFGNPENFEISKKESIVSSSDSLKKTSQSVSKKDFLESIPDYELPSDRIQEEESVEKSQTSQPQEMPKLLSKNKVTQYGEGFAESEEMSPVDRFNMQILKSSTWGNNPPYKQPVLPKKQPKKPSSNELWETYGDKFKKPKDKPFASPKELWDTNAGRIKKPRDRPFIERVEKKTRMPPPPLGHTMGHGLQDPKQLASMLGKTN